MLPPPYRQLREELAAFVPTERLIVDPLRLLAWGTDASFYRLIPKLARRRRRRGRASPRALQLRPPGHAGDIPRRRDEPFGPGDQRLRPRHARRRLARHRGRRRRRIDHSPAGRDRRGSQSPARSAGQEDRPGSGLDRRRDDRRHRRQQRQRHVLRHGAEQLPHARRAARRLRRRHGARHARCGKPDRVRAAAARAHRRSRRAGPGHARGHDARGAHPPQVPAQEHDRLQPERAGRLHRSVRGPRAI